MLKKNISLFIAVLWMVFSASSACADEPDIGIAPKSHNGHMNTALDKSLYCSADEYSNPSVSDQVMKIGMDFGNETVGWAQFENFSGGGFVFGYYDENRIFCTVSFNLYYSITHLIQY